MTDWHAHQLTGSPCGPRNCAACALADAVAAATDGRLRPTGDQVRTASGVSCVPGEHSPSGGLFVSDVIRTAARYGVSIDYGVTDAGYTRWAPTTLAARCAGARHGAVLLGDYDALPASLRAPGSAFLGDHSAYVHDFRSSDASICWHDPLRLEPIRIPVAAAVAYWQKPGSPIRGLAGFVALPIHRWWPSYLPTPPANARYALQVPPGTYWRLNERGVKLRQFTTRAGFTVYGDRLEHQAGRWVMDLIGGVYDGWRVPTSIGTTFRKPPE